MTLLIVYERHTHCRALVDARQYCGKFAYDFDTQFLLRLVLANLQRAIRTCARVSFKASAGLWPVRYARSIARSAIYPALLDAWREIVKTKAGHRTWPADVSPAKVARLSLDHWLNDVCLACTGRAYEPVRGQTTVMSDIACRACAGSGTRAVQAQHKMLHLVEDMVEALNAMAAHAAGQTMKRLATEIDR